MSHWNFAEAIYLLGQSDSGERTAIMHEDTVLSYAELSRRAQAIASWLATLGLPAGSHVGHYMRNSNAYMEAFTGASLAGMAHINVNYRYLDEELVDLCNGLDIRVLVYDTEFAGRVAAIHQQLTATVAFVEVGSQVPANDFAISLASLYAREVGDFQRSTSSDDLILIATGGTTGLPKGTQWRHEDLWRKLNVSMGAAMMALDLKEHPATIDEHVANVLSLPEPPGFLSLSPLMHGAGLMMALAMIAQGVPLVTVGGTRFAPDAVLDVIRKHKIGGLVLVGDAFALPLLESLERRRDENLLQSLALLVSSGASLGTQSKAALLTHQPNLIVLDTLGSSEASGYAMSTPEAGVFRPMPTTRVLDDEGNDVVPGSDTIGIAYSGGYLPIGYYNEPEKSAETFVTIDGTRYVMTGDRCTVRGDGMLVLLGRDSTVINTGGEKVYTVEVERILIDHPAIADALVVGLPHPRFGKMVVAVVEGPGLTPATLDEEDIKAHMREHLADYKVPRHIFAIESLQRAANGKPDYQFITTYAEASLDGR
ncbi:MAG: AMP-binding protein [Halioglobus sp.]|nr:AMP-binding protein [Halioglobus sp.]